MLSIVIPAYNSSRTVKQCLTAIYSSNYDNFEVIVVDDKSKDDTVNIIKNNFKDTKIIQLEKNSGAGTARNIGAKEAKGEIIVFIDSDIIIFPNTLNKINDSFHNKNVSASQAIYSRKCPINNFASQYQNLYQHYNFNLIKSKYIQIASTYCFAIRKKDFIDFDANKKLATTEDGEWGFKLYQNNNNILLDKEIEVQHLQKFTFKKILKRSFKLSRDKIKSIKKYKKQVKTDLNSTHHNKKKMMAIFLSPIPPLFWILNKDFFKFIYKEKGFIFLLKTILFHELNYITFLSGIIGGVLHAYKNNI